MVSSSSSKLPCSNRPPKIMLSSKSVLHFALEAFFRHHHKCAILESLSFSKSKTFIQYSFIHRSINPSLGLSMLYRFVVK